MSARIGRRGALALMGAAVLAASRGRASSIDRAVYVDLDLAHLYAIEEQDLVLSSRAIVGAAETPTPIVESVITHVRFRPSWRPTPDMLRRGDYEDGVRPPGPDNPLGLASVHFSGGGLIYLHGTNHPERFAEVERAISNGCVRVERLEGFVSWLLDWPPERTRAAMQGVRSFREATPHVPLIIARRSEDPILAFLAKIDESA